MRETVSSVVCGAALKQNCITSVTDAHGLRRRRQHHLNVGALVAEYLSAVATVMLATHNNMQIVTGIEVNISRSCGNIAQGKVKVKYP